jgi:hypothetical protein
MACVRARKPLNIRKVLCRRGGISLQSCTTMLKPMYNIVKIPPYFANVDDASCNQAVWAGVCYAPPLSADLSFYAIVSQFLCFPYAVLETMDLKKP